MRQLSLFQPMPLFHGGVLGRKKRKTLRPLARRRPLHLVLKSRKCVLFKNRHYLEKELRRLGEKFQLKLYSIAVNHDHLHAVLKLSDRKSYAAFIRSFTGILARKFEKGLWSLPPFTRVLSWGRDFRQALGYLFKNRREAAGEIPYEPRRNWYRRFKSS